MICFERCRNMWASVRKDSGDGCWLLFIVQANLLGPVFAPKNQAKFTLKFPYATIMDNTCFEKSDRSVVHAWVGYAHGGVDTRCVIHGMLSNVSHYIIICLQGRCAAVVDDSAGRDQARDTGDLYKRQDFRTLPLQEGLIAADGASHLLPQAHRPARRLPVDFSFISFFARNLS